MARADVRSFRPLGPLVWLVVFSAACGLPSLAGITPQDPEAAGAASSSAASSSEVSSADNTKGGGDLAAAAQNPIANNISLPFEASIYQRAGVQRDDAFVLNVQPVVPTGISEDWNLIHRPIIPIMDMPGAVDGLPEIGGQPLGLENTFGLGDINYTVFASPKSPGEVIWGVGPSLTFPTATADELGSGQWSAGPSVVALTIQRPWLFGGLWRQIWSFAGDADRSSVNQMILQPFANYNLPDGWYLHTSPIFVADWTAPSNNRWTIPIGGGVGKLFKIGDLPINASLQYYYNVETPDQGPEWQIKLVFQFLFPK